MADRGQLRVYLGAAPGVGKTYAMLCEAHRRAERGTDVVAGYVETHGRARIAELLEGLEVVPRKSMTYRGATFTELDVDAVIARRPQVALIDELAHTNIPGSRNAKRWQDIEEILERRHHGDHECEHPAPGIGQRRGAADHRGRPAGDGTG